MIRPPLHVNIETTPRCQAKCPGCPQPFLERKGVDMPLTLVTRLINEAAAMGTRQVLPYAYGEATLHADFVEIMRLCKASGMRVRLYTNGGMLHKPEIYNALRDYCDDLVFSVDGATLYTMRESRPGINPAVVVQYLDRFIAEPHRPIVTVRSTIFDHNKHEGALYCKRWRNADKVCLVPDIRTAPKRDVKKPCNRLFEQLPIYASGKAPLCCRDWEGE